MIRSLFSYLEFERRFREGKILGIPSHLDIAEEVFGETAQQTLEILHNILNGRTQESVG